MKKLLALFLVLILSLAIVPAAFADAIEITVPHFKCGENVGGIFFLPQVERFNAKYEGKYKVVIEELTQDIYGEKMQQLAIQGKLPPLIEGGTSEWLRDVVIPNKLYFDLSAFLKDHPELDEQIPDFQREYNTTEEGEYVSVSYNVVRPIGMYYNTALTSLSKEPGDYANWDEFLAEFGENKIALMTGENAWTLALIFSSMVAQEEGGVELLKAHATIDTLLDDFTAPCIVNAATNIKKLYDGYGTTTAIGSVYADAANTFMSNNAAVIANGSWMVSDFCAGAENKWSNGFDGSTVKGATFPGNIALSNLTGGYGWWIPATATDEEKEVAMAFLAFMLSKEEVEAYCIAEGGSPLMWNLSDAAYETLDKENPIMSSYTKAVNTETTFCPNILDCMPSSVANSGFGSLLPLLLDGSYTPEQFCEQLSMMAKEALED
ncbi:MAG: ABC transporter substrate-binding protein [Christensenellales bacterium]|jgi:raffinose/stachyose/melibiose transport system substrate-binding protein